jgi:hypothetical protein
MKQTTVPMKEDARLIIRSSADLLVEGSDLPQLSAVVDDSDSFRMKDEGGAIYIRADSDARLRVPAGVSLTLEKVGGDAGLLSLNGQVIIQRVGGDLTVQKVASFAADTIGGDCYCKEITGSVDLNRVGGDMDGFKVGQLNANDIGGDLELSGLGGKVTARVGGDVRLQINTPRSQNQRCRLAEVLICMWSKMPKPCSSCAAVEKRSLSTRAGRNWKVKRKNTRCLWVRVGNGGADRRGRDRNQGREGNNG